MGEMQEDVREYLRGREDARECRAYDDGSDGFTALVTLGFGGGPRSDSGAYGAGYEDGKKK